MKIFYVKSILQVQLQSQSKSLWKSGAVHCLAGVWRLWAGDERRAVAGNYRAVFDSFSPGPVPAADLPRVCVTDVQVWLIVRHRCCYCCCCGWWWWWWWWYCSCLWGAVTAGTHLENTHRFTWVIKARGWEEQRREMHVHLRNTSCFPAWTLENVCKIGSGHFSFILEEHSRRLSRSDMFTTGTLLEHSDEWTGHNVWITLM